ncbi:MAG: ribosomal subunit interface protein [Anaerolineaceae bacterium 4572_78]|nr:MAG: ribosomal subunit interface protein [Anaerolineaceae bacterium 4572_78]
MSVTINIKNAQVPTQTRKQIEKKVKKFNRFLPDLDNIRVDISQEQTHSPKKRYVIQITAQAGRKILRAEERQYGLDVAIDNVVRKLHSQIARLKGKRKNRQQDHKTIRDEMPELTEEELAMLIEEDEREIVRVKQFPVTPMDTEEAIEQMELLSHSFFVFYNAEIGRMNVLYKRTDNHYGLLDPILE